MRKRQRAKMMLRLQQNMKEKVLSRGEALYNKDEEGKELYVVEDGEVKLFLEGNEVSSVSPGELTGEHSLLYAKPRNIDAVCVSDECKLQMLQAKDFYVLLDSHPALKDGVRDISYRREFKKALCHHTSRSFPRTEKELLEAFRAIDKRKTGVIRTEDVHEMLRKFDPDLPEEHIRGMVSSLSLKESGKVSWAEFRHIYGMDKTQ